MTRDRFIEILNKDVSVITDNEKRELENFIIDLKKNKR